MRLSQETPIFRFSLAYILDAIKLGTKIWFLKNTFDFNLFST